MQKDQRLAAECRLFLVGVLAQKMKPNGIVSYPRARLAYLAGVSERQVGNYIKAARDGGWLVTITEGRRKTTAVYEATFPEQIAGSLEFLLIEPVSRKRKGTLIEPVSRKPRLPTTSKVLTRPVAVAATNQTNLCAETNHRTRVGKVERHRPLPSVAAPVETHPGGTDPATCSDQCLTPYAQTTSVIPITRHERTNHGLRHVHR